MIGVINSDMIGATREPGEPDWARPDIETRETWRSVVEVDVEVWAEQAPHLIIFEIDADQPQRVRQYAGSLS